MKEVANLSLYVFVKTFFDLGANRWERLTILRIKSTAKMQEYILITDVSLNTYWLYFLFFDFFSRSLVHVYLFHV